MEWHLTQNKGLLQGWEAHSGECRKQGLNGGIIAESFIPVREPVDVTRPENKAAAQLERVSPKSEIVLRVPGGLGPGAGLGIVASQQVKQVCALQFHGGIGFALLINEQGESDACFVAKSARIAAIAKSNGCQGRTAMSESLFVGAQLRDVLAAEDSTVVPQEDHHRGLADP